LKKKGSFDQGFPVGGLAGGSANERGALFEEVVGYKEKENLIIRAKLRQKTLSVWGEGKTKKVDNKATTRTFKGKKRRKPRQKKKRGEEGKRGGAGNVLLLPNEGGTEKRTRLLNKEGGGEKWPGGFP